MNKRTSAWMRLGNSVHKLTTFVYNISLFLHTVASSPTTVYDSHLSYWII